MEYAELSDRAKAYALDTYGQPPDDWHECIYEHAKEDGLERGFCIDNISFGGFHSQGDGASWTGGVQIDAFLEYHLKPDNPDYSRYVILLELIKDGWIESFVHISRRGYYYSHSGTMDIDYISSGALDNAAEVSEKPDVIEKGILAGANVYELSRCLDYETLLDDFCMWIKHEARAYADEIYEQLRKEYEYYTSEETFNELIHINGWRFDDAGKLIQE